MGFKYDAVVVGAGPNGLAAAIALQQQGLKVKLLEAKSTTGGGMRSLPLTLPGYIHDVCSAVHPMGIYSPFFKTLPLHNYGLEWIHPPTPLAHPFPDGSMASLEVEINKTAQSLGIDSEAYKNIFESLVTDWDKIGEDLLGPLTIPKHPLHFAKFGLHAIRSAEDFANSKFKDQYAKGLFAGLAAHSIRPLNHLLTAAIGLVLAIIGHKRGWPFPKGGTQKLAEALTAYFQAIGGEVETDNEVQSLDALAFARIKIFNLTPAQLLKIDKLKFNSFFKRQLQRYRYGPGVFKIDYALSEPVPFKATDCNRAGTVHIGGTLENIANSERMMWRGKHPDKPFILFSQHSLFDSTRAPQGKHTGWAYCHVPSGSTVDMTRVMENHIEEYAPGFRDIVLKRHIMNTTMMQQYNANYIGGDIAGGVTDLGQLFTRPSFRVSPYSTPLRDVYICSSSTPPGAGVHGMCGFHAAQKVLKDHYNM